MALLPDESENYQSTLRQTDKGITDSPYMVCPITFIQANPYQPRKTFNAGELESLSASIKEKGILQPLVVRKVSENQYELIAGERRLRAAIMAGLQQVPILIKDVEYSDRLELALIENIQRENLNPLEEAEAYAQLIEEFDLTQEVVSVRVGKNRSTVANSLRLLQLPDFAKMSLGKGTLSSGHARVLLSMTDESQVKLLHDAIIEKGLSVRATESLAKKIKAATMSDPKDLQAAQGLPVTYCQTVKKTLGDYLGAKINIIQKGSKGKLEIDYLSADDLERLLALIIQEQ